MTVAVGFLAVAVWLLVVLTILAVFKLADIRDLLAQVAADRVRLRQAGDGRVGSDAPPSGVQ